MARRRKATNSVQLKQTHPGKSGYWLFKSSCTSADPKGDFHTNEKPLPFSWKSVEACVPWNPELCGLAKVAHGGEVPYATSEWEIAQYLMALNVPKYRDLLTSLLRCIFPLCATHPCRDVTLSILLYACTAITELWKGGTPLGALYVFLIWLSDQDAYGPIWHS